LAQAFGTFVGAFSMFTRLERYHLELAVRTASGEQPVALRSLAPHLSKEAKRVILPAQGYAIGADQVDLVAGGLDDIARLVCDLRPEATHALARLSRGSFVEHRMSHEQVELPCSSDRR
jgi:hypothetical protein